MYEAGELDLIYVAAQTGRRLLKDSRFEKELVLVPAAQIQYLGLYRNIQCGYRLVTNYQIGF